MTARKRATRKRSARKPKQAARRARAGTTEAARKALGGRGKPRVVIDPEKLRKMASLGLSERDIATLLGISPTTLQARLVDAPAVREAVELGRAEVRRNIRAAQLQSALSDRNPTMLIWLGKTVLGQRERIGEGEGYEEPEEELTSVLTTKVMEFAARACREKERLERERREQEAATEE